MKNLKFDNLPFTLSADRKVLDVLSEMKVKDRYYLQQALVNEFEEIEAIDHQYMTLADVNRVLKILNLK